jgi:hypothetical protein
LDIKEQIEDHLNQKKINKEKLKNAINKIKTTSMEFFHFICCQQNNLVKQAIDFKNTLEMDFNNLIKKENELLEKLDFTCKNDVLDLYTELILIEKIEKVQTCFNYEFKKN